MYFNKAASPLYLEILQAFVQRETQICLVSVLTEKGYEVMKYPR